MKRLPLLLLASSLGLPLMAGAMPAFAQTATSTSAGESVEAARKALQAAEAALRNAEETGGDIRAAKRALADAQASLRAAEASAGIAPTAPAVTPTPTPVAPAGGNGPKPYTPPTVKEAAPAPQKPTAAAAPTAAAPQPQPPAAKAEAPAPTTKAAPNETTAKAAKPAPAPRTVTRLPDGETETRSRLADGRTIVEIRDPSGRLIRRIEVAPNGAETVLVDRARPRPSMNSAPAYPAPAPNDGFLPRIFGPRPVMPPAAIPTTIDGDRASEAEIARILAPMSAAPGRRYTVGEVSRSARLRDSLPGVTVSGLDFPKGSAHLTRDDIWRLGRIGSAMRSILERWPDQVFLIESHTDQAGPRAANRQLSARRAATIAGALVRNFGIPQQNLVAEGYGEDDPMAPPELGLNNRVTIRNITPLLAR